MTRCQVYLSSTRCQAKLTRFNGYGAQRANNEGMDRPLRCCKDCGFLGRQMACGEKDPFSPGRIYEALPDQRVEGHITHIHDHNIYDGPAQIVCAAGQFPLNDEYETALASGRHPGRGVKHHALDVIQKPRECSKWIRYRPGITPKEYVGMLVLEKLELDRRKYEKNSESERRAFEEQLTRQSDEDRRRWRKDLEDDRREWETKLRNEDDAKNRRFNRLVLLVGILGVVVPILCTVIQILVDAQVAKGQTITQPVSNTPHSPPPAAGEGRP